MNRNFGFQFNRFLLGGAVAVGLDWSTYFILTELAGINALTSKICSFFLGTIFSFFFNGRITFQAPLSTPGFIRHIALYSLSLIVNIITFRFIVSTILTSTFSETFIGLIVATSISLILNFLGMRYYVFSNMEGERIARS